MLLKELSLISAPKVNVEKTVIDQKEVISVLKDLITEVKALKLQEAKEVIEDKKEDKIEKKEEKKSYTFTINRDNNGFIQSVTANQQ